ncbi:unnamed protein product [Durusdinium trenchii]
MSVNPLLQNDESSDAELDPEANQDNDEEPYKEYLTEYLIDTLKSDAYFMGYLAAKALMKEPRLDKKLGIRGRWLGANEMWQLFVTFVILFFSIIAQLVMIYYMRVEDSPLKSVFSGRFFELQSAKPDHPEEQISNWLLWTALAIFFAQCTVEFQKAVIFTRAICKDHDWSVTKAWQDAWNNSLTSFSSIFSRDEFAGARSFCEQNGLSIRSVRKAIWLTSGSFSFFGLDDMLTAILAFFKWVIPVLLSFAGVHVLVKSGKDLDIVMNSTALTFVFTLDDIAMGAACPARTREMFQFYSKWKKELDDASLISIRKFAQPFHASAIFVGSVFGGLLFTFVSGKLACLLILIVIVWTCAKLLWIDPLGYEGDASV